MKKLKIPLRIIQVLTGLFLVFLTLGMLNPTIEQQVVKSSSVSQQKLAQAIISKEGLKLWVEDFADLKKVSQTDESIELTVFTQRDGQLQKQTVQLLTQSSSQSTLFLEYPKYSLQVEFDNAPENQMTAKLLILPKGVFWQSWYFFMKNELFKSNEALLAAILKAANEVN